MKKKLKFGDVVLSVLKLGAVASSLIVLIVDIVWDYFSDQQFFNDFPIGNDLFFRFMVFLLATLVIVEIVEEAQRFDRLEGQIINGFQDLLLSLDGVSVKRLSLLDDGFDYWARRLKEVKSSIEHVGFAPATAVTFKKKSHYNKAIYGVLKSCNVRYRYIAGLEEVDENGRKKIRRLDRILELLNDNAISQYIPAYFDLSSADFYPASFMLLDNEEIIALYPKHFGEPEVILSISHPTIVDMYASYFSYLWTKACPLSSENANSIQHQGLNNLKYQKREAT